MGIQKDNFSKIIFKGLPLAIAALGGLLLLYLFFSGDNASMPIIPGIFQETVSIPISYSQYGSDIMPLEMENFILFQTFESVSPVALHWASLSFGLLFWLFFILLLSLLSSFNRKYFILSNILTIALLTISGINGLNIGGPYSNYALMGLILGHILPVAGIHFWADHWNHKQRLAVIAIFSIGTLGILLSFSPIENAALWVSNHMLLPAGILTAIFLLSLGHVFISGPSIFLIRWNQQAKLKITWHIIILTFLYLGVATSTLLHLQGEFNLPFPTLPPIILIFLGVFLGYNVLKVKLSQIELPFSSPETGLWIYSIGLGIASLTFLQVYYTDNQPLYEFFQHIFIYGQVAFSLMFFIYLMANFSGLLNSGRDLSLVLFKPLYFAYFHMRIGGLMGLVVLIIFGNLVIGSQLTASSTHQTAEYYYAVKKPLESAILFESSWADYRKNDKAKNAAAHLRYSLGQPNLGMENLIESFEFVPNVPNILLLSAKLHDQDKIFESVYYLEKGLEYFPGNPYLLNNLALLYSKLDRGEEALASLEKIREWNEIALANRLGLVIKHRLPFEKPEKTPSDLITKINLMAFENSRGNFADFSFDLENLPENEVQKSAILRNQWSNKVSSSFEKDIALLDSLIQRELPYTTERDYRETRILRTYQESYINETLKYLNGTAEMFSGSRGYYHAMAAKMLMAQLDFEKAANDFTIAAQFGVETFTPLHLAVLYYGGKPIEAIQLNQKLQVEFPVWMEWDEKGLLQTNEMTLYFESLARLHKSLPEVFMADLNALSQPALKAEFATYIMSYKIHFLDKSMLEEVKKSLLSLEGSKWTEKDIEDWWTFFKEKQSNSIPQKVKEHYGTELPWDRNAYFAPLVIKAFEREKDELKKYEILQEAIQFNQDPMLWILYIIQSRKIGLDNYSSSANQTLRNWVSSERLEQLLLENSVN